MFKDLSLDPTDVQTPKCALIPSQFGLVRSYESNYNKIVSINYQKKIEKTVSGVPGKHYFTCSLCCL